MAEFRVELSSPPCWEPAQRLLELVAERSCCSRVGLADLMYMGRLVAAEREPIFLYKHRVTRAYLCLDRLGHTYEVRRSAEGLSVETAQDLDLSVQRLMGSEPTVREAGHLDVNPVAAGSQPRVDDRG